MGSRSKAVGDQLHEGVDEVADKDSRGENFSIWTLLLVQVPCSAHTQELTGESCAVKDDDHDVDDLNWNTRRERL